MADDKTKLPSRNNILAATAFSGKTISGVEIYVHGNVVVVEVTHNTATRYLKVKGLQAKVGTTIEWSEGTQVL